MLRPLLIASLILILFGCSNENRKGIVNEGYNDINLDYAHGFSIVNKEGFKEVIVNKAFKNAKNEYRYALITENMSVPEGYDEVVIVPVKNIVSTSTTHLPFLELLEVGNSLIGFPGTDYISSPTISKRVKNGLIRELGTEKEINVELIIDSDPEMVLGYLLTGDFGSLEKIRQAGIPVILNAEYLEDSPLGKVEWIKFVAAFYQLESKADSIFNAIKKNYLEIRELTQNVDFRPSVFSGVMYGDTWFMPGGQSWASKFFNDGGASFLWKDDSTRGSIELNYESVYDQAYNVDFWIGAASFNNLEEMAETDQRYTNFKAFDLKNVYTYTKRINDSGGNDFFETGSARPDLILKDIVKILHPELLPNYELYFYKQLK